MPTRSLEGHVLTPTVERLFQGYMHEYHANKANCHELFHVWFKADAVVPEPKASVLPTCELPESERGVLPQPKELQMMHRSSGPPLKKPATAKAAH